MTIALTYLDDLSRVQIALSGLAGLNTVQVQQSVNQLLWTVVRGGAALDLDAGTATLDDFDGWVSDEPNFYRVVPVDPASGLLLNGTAGDYASTPNHASLQITGDIDLRADISPTQWDSGTGRGLVGRYNAGANQRSYLLLLLGDAKLRLNWSTDGATPLAADSDVPLPFALAPRLLVRATLDVDNGAGGRTITFSYSTGAAFTRLGDPVEQVGVTSINVGTEDLAAGAFSTGTNVFDGMVHAVEVRDGIGGTIVANPDFAAQPSGTTSFVDGAGRTWSVNGAARIIGSLVEPAASITPSLHGQVWLKSILHPFLNRVIECANYGDIDRQARAAIDPISGRSVPVSVSDLRLSREFTLSVVTRTEVQTRDLDLMLASGDTMFLHVPPEDVQLCQRVKLIPGGYVEIGDTSQRRRGLGGTVFQWLLPMTVVAPPGPDVVGATMTYQGLLNLFGTYQNMTGTSLTYAELTALVGEPSDVVVP